MSNVQMDLVCCTQVLCQIAGDPSITQKDIALTYAMAIKSEANKADQPDWSQINRAIVARWKAAGLDRIKKRAWDILSGKAQP